jgi:hypothetical protein
MIAEQTGSFASQSARMSQACGLPVLSHHRPRIERHAPAVLLHGEHGRELDEQNRGDDRANGGLAKV